MDSTHSAAILINYFLLFSHCSTHGPRTWSTAHGLNDEETALEKELKRSSKMPICKIYKGFTNLNVFSNQSLRLKKEISLILSAQLQMFQSWSGLSTLNSVAFHVPKAELPLTLAVEIHCCCKPGSRTPG